MWGRFPLERLYKMDQVTFPFVNGQEDTFTMEDDNNLNIKCPKECLCKFHFTIHSIFNDGTGDKSFGCCGIIYKGTGERIVAEDK